MAAAAKDRAFYENAAQRTAKALQDTVSTILKTPGSQWITGYVVLVWDAEGNGLVQCHHSMASGVEPEQLPHWAADLIGQSNEAASYEASCHTAN